MDDIKVYSKNEKELKSLVHFCCCSNDVGIEFEREKCAVSKIKRVRFQRSQGIKMTNGQWENDSGILEADEISQNEEMKQITIRKYTRRVRK